MKYLIKYHFFIFPALIIVIGFFIYNILDYKPTTMTILINIGTVYLLAPKISFLETQTGQKTQLKWLFLKKAIIID